VVRLEQYGIVGEWGCKMNERCEECGGIAQVKVGKRTFCASYRIKVLIEDRDRKFIVENVDPAFRIMALKGRE